MKELIIFCCLLFASLYSKAFVVYGDTVEMGQGTVRAFADIDENGKPLQVGLALTEESLQGLPDHMPGAYSLRLPSILNIPPYNHMVINWMPQGHEPDSIYGLAHFDFHFYFISEDQVGVITCAGDDRDVCMKTPEPDELPPFYVPTPDGVPQMGWHWLDSRSPELNGGLFTSTFIYGFYNGKNHFIEPMITRDFIMKNELFEMPISMPLKAGIPGYYPSSYSLQYDMDKKMYFVSLKNLTLRE